MQLLEHMSACQPGSSLLDPGLPLGLELVQVLHHHALSLIQLQRGGWVGGWVCGHPPIGGWLVVWAAPGGEREGSMRLDACRTCKRLKG